MGAGARKVLTKGLKAGLKVGSTLAKKKAVARSGKSRYPGQRKRSIKQLLKAKYGRRIRHHISTGNLSQAKRMYRKYKNI